MTREGLKIVITVIMKNHVYNNFNGELRKQKEGGAIGMDITGEIAKIFRTWWDKQLLLRLNKLNINPFLYKRYVDDISIGVQAIEEGYEYVEGGLNRSEEEQMNNIPRDQRTFGIIRNIGDDIQKSIQLTADVPSNYSDGRGPILDLKCWVAEVETEKGKCSMILHEHYVKAVSSKTVIHRNSAMSLSSKRTILMQQCLRIMLNCNTHIGWEKIYDHLSFYTARMQVSGYDHSLRLEKVKSALGAYNKMKEADEKQ